jgi:diguanylate cyclase (GGDEF)-like protein
MDDREAGGVPAPHWSIAESGAGFSDGLEVYLESIRQLTGAERASLFIPGEKDLLVREDSHFLLHVGLQPPIADLADVPAARSTCERLAVMSSGHRVIESFSGSGSSSVIVTIWTDTLLRHLEMSRGDSLLPERRIKDRTHTYAAGPTSHWIGLGWAADQSPLLPEKLGILEASLSAQDLGRVLAISGVLVSILYRHVILQQDPLTRLPGRSMLQHDAARLFSWSTSQRLPLSLLLLNPDDFVTVNQRFGRQLGDAALMEVADRLRAVLRHSDRVFRYGGAVFAVLLPESGLDEVKGVADKLRHALTRQPYSGNAIRLSFSIGVAVYDPTQPADRATSDVDELFQWADNAISQVKLAGGGHTQIQYSRGDTAAVGSLDRLSGIFTADTEKDYRNMLLLWDTVAFIACHTEQDKIAKEFISRVGAVFNPHRAAVFSGAEIDKIQLLAEYVDDRAIVWSGSGGGRPPLSDAQQRLFEQVRERGRVERQCFELKSAKGRGRKEYFAYSIPMIAGESYQGYLYLEESAEGPSLDSSDVVFLGGLANQVANALLHAYLAARWKQEKEHESSLLKKEVRGLREALGRSKMVLHSPQMQAVIESLRKVAPTDATVLVMGESGTGKEMLARALHELSPRRERPFIIVDCGAISPTLVESELFGRAKGAYTGANSASAGRILQAEGGTLFLDEVGELPLDVQAKLLRFVQEKEITPVGANQSRRVDVRIVTATNRELAEEVRLGRFRKDLYYRLQVFVIASVPLRERPDDILPLARYFIEKFCVQYQKSHLRLTAEAETALLAHPWPGNVRELQNQILKAVVMSTSGDIDAKDILLPSGEEHRLQPAPTVPSPQAPTAPAAPSAASAPSLPLGHEVNRSAAPAVAVDLSGDPWEVLRRELSTQVALALARGKATAAPLGCWLIEDLVLLANEAHHGNARRASMLLGMPETTFRRQLQKVRFDQAAGRLTRSGEWRLMGPVLSQLLTAMERAPVHKANEQIRTRLLEEVMARLPDKDKISAALMGVTLPTYRRWRDAVQGTPGAG